jgi:hypothetical protein
MSNAPWHYVVEVRKFPYEIQVSERKAAKYHKKSAEAAIPKKYMDSLGVSYFFNKAGFLVNKAGQRVVKNTKTVGKPNMVAINGQKFSSGMHHKQRAIIFSKMKKYLSGYVFQQIKGQIPTGTPIVIWMEYHRPVGIGNWDLDNATWMWFKWFNDVLKETGKIPEDNITIIQSTNAAFFFPTDTDDERKLVFHIQPLYGTTFKLTTLINKVLTAVKLPLIPERPPLKYQAPRVILLQ